MGLMGDCGARCGQLVQTDATGRIGLYESETRSPINAESKEEKA
jgi:hypothetical protein